SQTVYVSPITQGPFSISRSTRSKHAATDSGTLRFISAIAAGSCRAQVGIEGLYLRERERIGEGRKMRARKALRDERQHRRRLRENAAIRHHRGYPPLRIDREIFRAALLLPAEIDVHGRIFRARLLQGDVGGERARVRRVVKLDHDVRVLRLDLVPRAL